MLSRVSKDFLNKYESVEDELEVMGLPKITERLRNLIKNNYHRHKTRRKPFDEATVKDLCLFYDRLGLSKNETEKKKFHIQNWLKKKVTFHNPKTQIFPPYFSDEQKYKALPSVLSKRIKNYKLVDGVRVEDGTYRVVLTKECYDALPIKPGRDCKFIGKSVFMPAYKPQVVRGSDFYVNKFRKVCSDVNHVLYHYMEEIPERFIVSPGWASQQNEFQIFCDPVKEKYKARDILRIVSKNFYKIKLPQVEEVLPIDCFHVPVNGDSSVGFIPECFFGKGVKQKSIDHLTRFPAYSILHKAREGLFADRTIWTVGGRARAQKVSMGESLRSRFLVVPDAIPKIVCLAGVADVYKGMTEINKKYSGNELMSGIDFMNGNFDRFDEVLNRYEYCLEADLKRFDQHVGREILKAAFSILRGCYPEGEKMDNLFFYYASGFINKNIVIPGGLMYRVRKSVATGSPFTSIIGTIVNWINWTLVMEELGINGKFYKLMVYGDDTLILFRHFWLLNSEDIKRRLFLLTGHTGDPLVFKKIQANYFVEKRPIFLKTFSFYGLPGRYFDDLMEKAFYPEHKAPTLFERVTRVKQLFFNPCFNYDAAKCLSEFYVFLNKEIFYNAKRVTKKGVRKGFISLMEFYFHKGDSLIGILQTTFMKYSAPPELRNSWSNFNFEKFKDKLIPNLILVLPRFDDVRFTDYYGINYQNLICQLYRSESEFSYHNLL